jgi:ribonuclease BN (tRNA processing enzyme)
VRFKGGGRTYALTGDGQSVEELVAFLRGVDVAVIDSGHIDDDVIIEVAVAAQPSHIVCSHLYREIDGERLTALATSKGFTGVITQATQGMQWQWE